MTDPRKVPFAVAPAEFDPEAFAERLHRLTERSPFELPTPDVPPDFKRSSVLACFWQEGVTIRVLLTRRSAGLRTQPRQMSFPGGRLEDGEDWVAGALRETEEEVAIPSSDVEILGRLDDAWSGARHKIVPIVGWLDRPPAPRANPDEVESIHRPHLHELLDPSAYRVDPVELAGARFHNATIDFAGGNVFGLTADLLIEAIQWGLGQEEHPGHERLASLRAWLRMKATEG